jgi:hypothetical protein
MSTSHRVGKANPILGKKLPSGSIEKSNSEKFTLVPIFSLNYLDFVPKLYWFHYNFLVHPQFYPPSLEYFIDIL